MAKTPRAQNHLSQHGLCARRAGLAMGVGLACLSPALAQDALVWESNSYPAQAEDEIGLSIGLGVPQTDAILASGACFAGADGRPVFRMSLGANPGALPDGAAVLAEVEAIDGTSASLVGRVTGASGELGVTGVATELRLGDPVLDVLGLGTPTLVTIAGGGDDLAEYPATDAAPLLAFIDDCAVAVMGEMPMEAEAMEDTAEDGTFEPAPQVPAPQAALPQPTTPQPAVPQPAVPQPAQPQIAQPQPTAPPAQPAADAGAEFFACTALGQLASQETGQPRSVLIDNRSPAPRSINWVGPDGTVTEFGQLQPGQSGTLTSDAGHVWMFGDAQGACVEVARVAGASALLLRQTAAVAPPQPTFTPAPAPAPAPQAPANTK